MLTINDVPNELVLNIFEHIHVAEEPIATFRSLCQTSRRLQTAAEPFLYHTYRHRIGLRPIHHFAGTLADRPKLARHVRKIDIELMKSARRRPPSTPERESTRKLRRAVERFRLPPPRANAWKSLVSEEDNDIACAALIISVTPKIEELWLSYDQEWPLWWLELMDAASNPLFVAIYHGFNHLHTVKINRGLHSTGFVLLWPLCTILALPSLRYLEVRGCLERGPEAGPSDDQEWLQLTSTVETVVFLESELSGSAINQLFRSCKAVKHFHYEMGLLPTSHQLLDYSSLDLALTWSADSLETLQIDFSNEETSQIWGFDFNVISSLQSLSKFPNLRKIDVPINAILQFDENEWEHVGSRLGALLPKSLEEFSLCNPIQRHQVRFSQLEEFVDKDVGNFPNLKLIHVRSTEPRHPDWDKLAEKLSNTNVSIVVD